MYFSNSSQLVKSCGTMFDSSASDDDASLFRQRQPRVFRPRTNFDLSHLGTVCMLEKLWTVRKNIRAFNWYETESRIKRLSKTSWQRQNAPTWLSTRGSQRSIFKHAHQPNKKVEMYNAFRMTKRLSFCPIFDLNHVQVMSPFYLETGSFHTQMRKVRKSKAIQISQRSPHSSGQSHSRGH